MAIVTNSVWERELIAIVGEAGLLKLEDAWGGTYIHIHVTPQPELVEVIGQGAAQALTDEYGSFDIYIPTKLKRMKRNIAIRRDGKNTGVTLEALAAKYRLSTRRIKDILRETYDYNT
ncbi:Mor transcription activator family protein [Idiomarina xiamenensis]|uniref:Mor transcription activator domain-containing protein n=1 Tax=Idiomarina xiamenensis 10-D-4 TaxID=740709 RepID=K2KPJ1_9GAMM|nr:Mor transcription activator family protein [Idiomarina xiamenensis]EKE79460.1 hypothetical protein A10D4_12869 [Idiomarina xiamenensis 10-D-4]